MEFIADILLIAGASAAAFYCIVLSRRLKRFNDLEKGVGGAIAVLSTQVDDMTKTLELAQNTANGSNDSLLGLTSRAEDVARRLELLVASMHDLPEPTVEQPEHRPTTEFQSLHSANPSSDSGRSDQSSAFRTARAVPPKEAA